MNENLELSINLEEYYQLINDFKIIVQKLENFQFKFTLPESQNMDLCSAQANPKPRP